MLISAGFFLFFFRDHPNFHSISGTFSSTISGVSQSFQGSLATLVLKTVLCKTLTMQTKMGPQGEYCEKCLSENITFSPCYIAVEG